MKTPLTSAAALAGACLLFAAACNADLSGTDDDKFDERCETAAVDAQGVCRASDGTFARNECCLTNERCASAEIDKHGICRASDGTFAPTACCSGDQCAVFADGTCDVDCGEPDLDCFVTFETTQDAEQWIAEAQQPEQSVFVPKTDPRYRRMRALIETGWEAYISEVRTGQLVTPPELVVLEDEDANAFVMCRLQQVQCGYVVAVNTGLLDAKLSDAAVLGIVFHELEHAIALHPLRGTSLNKYYQARLDSPEPLGFLEQNDPALQAVFEPWLEAAEAVGPSSFVELSDLPVGGVLGALLDSVQASAFQITDARCADLGAAFGAWISVKIGFIDPLDGVIHMNGREAEMAQASSAFATALGTCLGSDSPEFLPAFSEHTGVPEADIRSGMSPEELQLADGVAVLPGIRAFASLAQEGMRGAEASINQEFAGGMETVRYFSTEEAADDRAVQVLRAAGLPTADLSAAFASFGGNAGLAECQALLDAGQTPPYGDLSDDHHAGCWRADHVRRVDAHLARQGAKDMPRARTELRAQFDRRMR